MGFPHQVLPLVAAVDIITAVAASVHLGLLPLPRSFTFQGHSMLNHFFSRLQGTTPAFASHRIVIEQSNPKKLLLWMLVICIVRCVVIITVWTSIKKGIQNGRVRSRSEDYSSRAILYSIVCVLSILINLSNLNTLFQTRGAPPNASLSSILLHLSASSLAAEQLVISGIEWLLFALVAGTHGLSSGGPDSDDALATTQEILDINIASEEEAVEEEQEEAERAEEEDTTEVQASPEKPEVQEQVKSQKDYGSLTELRPAAQSEPSEQPQEFPSTSNEERIPSSSTTSNTESADPSAMSSDIVDIPKDRKASMMGAKQRLDRARENGRLRRRSLWNKIRGKGGEATPPSSQVA